MRSGAPAKGKSRGPWRLRLPCWVCRDSIRAVARRNGTSRTSWVIVAFARLGEARLSQPALPEIDVRFG
jgi:hypothetical protein